MARNHARIELSIWDDDDFLALSPEAQRLYLFLISQRDLTWAGLLPMRLRRWSGRARGSTPDSIAAALAELDAARFVVCDHDTEEVLVRALIRRDRVYKQPNTLAGALRGAFEIASPVLRAALADELRRLPAEVGDAPELAAAALLAGLGEMPPAVKAALEQRAGRSTRTTTTKAPAEPVASPRPRRSESMLAGSAMGSAMGSRGSQGEGGREQGLVSPVTDRSSHRGGSRVGASVPAREATPAAADLVAEHVGPQPARVARQLAAEVDTLLAEGATVEHVGAGLRRWAGKTLPPRALPEFVAEAMRGVGLPGALSGLDALPDALPGALPDVLPGRDAKVAGWLALGAEARALDQRDDQLGDQRDGRAVGGLSVGELVGVAA